MVDVSKFGQHRRDTDRGVSVTIPAAEFLLGDEAVTLLRKIRQAYFEDAKYWGMPAVGEDDARRFMRAYERLMCSTGPQLHSRIMDDGLNSPYNDPDGTLPPILGIR